MRSVLALGLVCATVLLGSSCGEAQRVGSEKLLEFEEQQDAQRLGERTPPPAADAGTPAPLTVGEDATPSPTSAEATPEPTARVVDVVLVSDSPYYEPGNLIRIPVGATLRVTNRDSTPERSRGRSFTDKNGTFHSGMLGPGESWTWRFDRPARYEVIDEGLNFATATLEVLG